MYSVYHFAHPNIRRLRFYRIVCNIVQYGSVRINNVAKFCENNYNITMGRYRFYHLTHTALQFSNL